MATQHTVTAPLVITKGVDGADLYLYSGAVVPELAEGETERLVEGGFVAKVEPDGPVTKRAASTKHDA